MIQPLSSLGALPGLRDTFRPQYIEAVAAEVRARKRKGLGVWAFNSHTGSHWPVRRVFALPRDGVLCVVSRDVNAHNFVESSFLCGPRDFIDYGSGRKIQPAP